jgi:uncharacterized membrane protein YkvA (DUF1232 family)
MRSGNRALTPILNRLREWARRLKQETLALYYVARDPRTPVVAKLVAAVVVAYAVSPIDLIPDFIPVLGYLDDLLLVPAGLWLALKLTPAPVLEAARAKAREDSERPTSPVAAAVVVAIWLVVAVLLSWWAYANFVA